MKSFQGWAMEGARARGICSSGATVNGSHRAEDWPGWGPAPRPQSSLAGWLWVPQTQGSPLYIMPTSRALRVYTPSPGQWPHGWSSFWTRRRDQWHSMSQRLRKHPEKWLCPPLCQRNMTFHLLRTEVKSHVYHLLCHALPRHAPSPRHLPLFPVLP